MSVEATNWAYCTHLKSNLKFVLVALADHANAEGVCWPSIKSMMKKCTISASALINSINKLCDLGVIEKQKRYNDGRRTSNVYRINLELNPDSVHTESIRMESVSTESVSMEKESLSPESIPTTIDEPSLNPHSYNSSAVQKKPTNKTTNKEYRKCAVEILNLLNEKANKGYKQTEANLGIITARLKEMEKLSSFEEAVKACRQVVIRQCREWNKDEANESWESRKYLRPATLFNKTKFSNYEGELVCTNVEKA